MHECPECGSGCCCDQEDVFHEYGEAVENCTHVCREWDDDDYDDEDEDDDDDDTE